jgi:hypothetical protein
MINSSGFKKLSVKIISSLISHKLLAWIIFNFLFLTSSLQLNIKLKQEQLRQLTFQKL